MLRLALRALTLLRMTGTIASTKRKLSEQVSHALAIAALMGAAALIGTVGALFIIIALFLALSTVWPAHWAAFTVGVLLLVAAGVIVLLARNPPQRRRSERRPPTEAAADNEPGLQDMIRPAEIWVQRHPLVAIAAAIGIGAIFGLSRGGRPSNYKD